MAISFTITTNLTITCIIVLVFSFSTRPRAAATAVTRRPFSAIYAFGDSLTDTGNTHSATGPSGFMFVSNLPYGRTFFHRPTNRYSDGRLVIDFLAQSLSLPFIPPYLDRSADRSSGVNFAVAGATAIIHSFFVKNNMTLNITPQSIRTQLDWFDSLLESRGCVDSTATPEKCEAVFEDALIWVGELGANDYAYSFGSSVSPQTIRRLAINSVTGFLQTILNKGAKYVVVQGLPPTGCLTLSMYLSPVDGRDEMGCAGSVNNQTYSHNTALQAQIHLFRKQFPKSVIVYADFYNAYRKVMKNPSAYGFKELYKVCCGYGGGDYNFDYFNACGSPNSRSCTDPFEYINWDGVHLTEAMYRVMADALLNGTFSDPPFSYLLRMKQRSG